MRKTLPVLRFIQRLVLTILRPIYIFTCIFLFIVVSSFYRTPEDEVDKLYQSAHSRLSLTEVAFLKAHFVHHTEPCKSISEVGGWVWKCTHSDGFAVYNCFRKCRGTIEAARLFLGLNDNEDCDSFIILNGKRQFICYPRQASEIVRNHGQAIAIEIARGWP